MSFIFDLIFTRAYFPEIKKVTWQWSRTFQGQFVVHRLELAMSNPHQIWSVYDYLQLGNERQRQM